MLDGSLLVDRRVRFTPTGDGWLTRRLALVTVFVVVTIAWVLVALIISSSWTRPVRELGRVLGAAIVAGAVNLACARALHRAGLVDGGNHSYVDAAASAAVAVSAFAQIVGLPRWIDAAAGRLIAGWILLLALSTARRALRHGRPRTSAGGSSTHRP